MLFKNLLFWSKINSEQFFTYDIIAWKYKYIFGIFKIAFFKWQYYFSTENKNPLIIDCGANIWVTSLFFDFLYPWAEIHTFEPNPEIFGYLKNNTKNNNNIHNHQLAVSDQKWELDFYITTNNAWDTLASLHDSRNQLAPECIKAQVVLLSEFIQQELQGRTVDCIKFNIEWSEDRVISDLANNNCLQYIDHMIFEYHHHLELVRWSKLASMLNDLEDHWFNYTLSVTNFRLYKEDVSQNVFIHAYRKRK